MSAALSAARGKERTMLRTFTVYFFENLDAEAIFAVEVQARSYAAAVLIARDLVSEFTLPVMVDRA